MIKLTLTDIDDMISQRHETRVTATAHIIKRLSPPCATIAKNAISEYEKAEDELVLLDLIRRELNERPEEIREWVFRQLVFSYGNWGSYSLRLNECQLTLLSTIAFRYFL